MGIQLQGNAGVIADVDGTLFRALRVVNKPLDYGTLGIYQYSAVSGVLAAALAANAVVFSARWGDATRLCALLNLKIRFLPLTPFTAATLTDHTSFDAFVARAFTASHTGGTAANLTGNNQKLRTSMGSSLFTDIRIATTAALGGGTLTVDAHPFMQSLRKGNRVNPAAATEETIQPTTDGADMEQDVASGWHPPVFAQNEGFVVRNRAVWPAAGTGLLKVEMSWAELTTY